MTTKTFSQLPGPWGLPIFGSIFDLLGQQQGKILAKWAEEHYGPLFRLRIGSRQFIAVQGYELIKEALITKANCFSGRMDGEIFDRFRNGKGLFLSDSENENFKFWHEFANQGLTSTWEIVIKGIRKEAGHLESYLSKHLEQEIDLRNILIMTMMNCMMQLCFSKRYDLSEDQADFFFHKIYASVIDSKWNSMVFLPWLKFLPSLKRYLEQTEENIREEIDWIFNLMEERKSDSVRDSADLFACFEQSYQAAGKNTNQVLSQEHFATLVADLLFAGSSTTANQLLWTLLFLLKHPDCMKKVQEELNLKGSFSMEEVNELHYTRAVIHETYRMRPIAPTAMMHKTTQNTTLMKYQIPEGTNVMVNLWSVHMDKQLWGPNPDVFQPERHLNKDGTFCKSPYVIPFSMGLRKCIGKRLADAEILTFLSSILHNFQLQLSDKSRSVDLNGMPGTILKPNNFSVIISSRQ